MKQSLLMAPRQQKPSQTCLLPRLHLPPHQLPTQLAALDPLPHLPTHTCIGQAYNTTFGMPSGIKLSQFDGSDWSNWLGILKALLTLHEAEDIFALKTAPSRVDKGEWDSLQRRTKAYLHLYVKPMSSPLSPQMPSSQPSRTSGKN